MSTLVALPGSAGGAPPYRSIWGMTQGAVYDAVNAIEPRHHRPSAEQSSDVLTFPARQPAASVAGVPSYLVETFLPRGGAGERGARERRARSVASELTGEGARVRFRCSIHVPDDEICFFVFDASSGRDGGLAAARAALDPLRVIEAVPSRKEKA